jgi:hypothetical protein
MLPAEEFRSQPPEFWALVKLSSMEIGFSRRKTRASPSVPLRYTADQIARCLRGRGLDPRGYGDRLEAVVRYVDCRADLLENVVQPNLMDRAEAKALFESVRDELDPPPELVTWNKQKGDKRHEAYLACVVNFLTWRGLRDKCGEAQFDPSPRGPLTFSRDGMPLRTLFRRMDGAYPELNHPLAAWEVKEYYGTTTFGSRVADGVYETALDGYELNDLRDVGVDVKHYLFADDRYTWWECGKSYVCRIVDMLHADLLDGAFFGREVVADWPAIVASWPDPAETTS